MENRTKRNNNNRKKVLLLLLTGIIIALLIIFILKINDKNNKEDEVKTGSSLLGLWTIDEYTDYEFSKEGKGKLKVPSSEYPFTYKTEDNKLYIDFENELSKDSSYEYSFEGEKMIWKGIEETTGTFTFTKR